MDYTHRSSGGSISMAHNRTNLSLERKALGKRRWTFLSGGGRGE